jgi:xanthine dehydrogenase accessory factor
MRPSLLREAADLAERGVACALAAVVETHGSVPGKVGAAMLVTVDGTSRGTVGGAGLEEKVKTLCRDAIRTGKGGVHAFDLARWKEGGLDSVCGGTVRVAIHVLRPAPHLLLVGGGHCSLALARILDVLEWGYSVVDSRPGYASPERFPHARHLSSGLPRDLVDQQEDLSRFSHVYVMGHSHAEDGDAVLALLARGYPGVIGVIGSKAKLHAFQERADACGLPPGSFDAVRSPIGVDVGATTPEEIAVAVAAEIIADVKGHARADAARPASIPSHNPTVGNP